MVEHVLRTKESGPWNQGVCPFNGGQAPPFKGPTPWSEFQPEKYDRGR